MFIYTPYLQGIWYLEFIYLIYMYIWYLFCVNSLYANVYGIQNCSIYIISLHISYTHAYVVFSVHDYTFIQV